MTFPVRLIWHSRPRRLQQPPNLSGRSFGCSTLVAIPPSVIRAEISLALCGQRYAERACAEWLDLHHHHQVVQPVPGPAAEPTHLPVAEAEAERNWCPKAKVFRSEPHRADRCSGQHI